MPRAGSGYRRRTDAVGARLFAGGDEAVVVPVRLGPERERLLVGLSSCYDSSSPRSTSASELAPGSVIASAWSSSLPGHRRPPPRDSWRGSRCCSTAPRGGDRHGRGLANYRGEGASPVLLRRPVVDPWAGSGPGARCRRVWEIDGAARAGSSPRAAGTSARDRVAPLDAL